MKEMTLNGQDVVLVVGAGPMAIEYAKVLLDLGKQPVVVGRGKQSAQAFREQTGVEAAAGGLRAWLATLNGAAPPSKAIVAASEKWVGEVARDLISAGVNELLLEKPGGLDVADILAVQACAEEHAARVHVGYNRRFYSAVEAARRQIELDGGVTSFQFEFTEWAHVIGPLVKEEGVKEQWFLSNSTHVIDLAFHLGGRPTQWSAWSRGALPWHPTGAVFAGAGETDRGALFSYQANWEAPGRWGVEVLTRRHRLIFRPMEKLQIQKIGSVAVEPVDLQSDLDSRFKPGLHRQVQAFLGLSSAEHLPTIQQQVEMLPVYQRMRGDAA